MAREIRPTIRPIAQVSVTQDILNKYAGVLEGDKKVSRRTLETASDDEIKDWLKYGFIRPEDIRLAKAKIGVLSTREMLSDRLKEMGYTNGILPANAIATAGEELVNQAYNEGLLDPNVMNLINTAKRQAANYGIDFNPYLINKIAIEGGAGMKPEELDTYLYNIKTQQEITTKEKAYTEALPQAKQQITNILQDLGLGVDETTVNYFADKIASGVDPYEIKQTLMTSPEYQNIKATQEREAIKAEAAAVREELEKQLSETGGEFFRTKLAPVVERRFKRLGGEGRASAVAALGYAASDVAKQRERTLASAGLEESARLEGYRREDYLRGVSAEYQAALQNYQKDRELWARNLDFEMQKYWYPIQKGATRAVTLAQERLKSEERSWQDYVLNKQRSWQIEDRSWQEGLVKQQNWANILGFLGGKIATMGLGALTGIEGGALAGLTGMYKG